MADNQDIVIDMKAGRGENGFSATLDIVPAGMNGKATPMTTESKAAAEPKAETKANISSTPENRKEPETKSVSKPTFGKKAEAQPEPDPVVTGPDEEDTGSSLDDRGNTMAEEPHEPDEAAPSPRGIFSKASNG